MRACLVSVLIASLVSFALNTVLTQRVGSIARALVVPVVEEVSKTGLSLLLGAGILPVHIAFGMVEGLLEWRLVERTRGVVAGLLSIVSHSLFGALTIYVYAYTQSPLGAISAAVLLHAFWNAVVYDLTRMPKRS